MQRESRFSGRYHHGGASFPSSILTKFYRLIIYLIMINQALPEQNRRQGFMPVDLDIRRDANGEIFLRSNNILPEYDANIVRVILRRAATEGAKPALADRDCGGGWRFVTFTQFAERVRGLAQWLIERAPRDSTLMIVAENSPEVAVATFAGLAAGMRVLPVGPAVALADDDHVRLRHVIVKSRPAVAFVQDDRRIFEAVRACVAPDCIMLAAGIAEAGAMDFDDAARTPPGPMLDDRIDALDTRKTACLMMTSGSTGLPKLVELSLSHLAANVAQARAALGGLAGWGEASVDWMPWNHAAGASVLRSSLMLGGTLYIDRGKPLPGLFAETIRNLKEVPVPYFNNVPLGFVMLADALEADAELRRTFFSRMRLMIYGGAGLPQTVMDRLQEMAFAETGRRIPVTTGYGATETVSGCLTVHFACDRIGIGLPAPGVELRLTPAGDRYALALRGPNVMRSYLDEPERTAEAFDADGFYRTGDLVRFQDAQRPELGLVFAGRQTEEFKLSNGAWVYGGALRTQLLDLLAPLAKDVVLCDEDRPFLALLVWPHDDAGAAALGRIRARIRGFNRRRQGATARIGRVALIDPPPDPARSEISDKGGLVRRRIIDNRPSLIDRLYREGPDLC